jgi:orotate phosphoribosyltransferase
VAAHIVLRPAAELRAELLEVVRARGYTRAKEPFQLSSGGTSYDYVDMRRAVAEGPDLELAARAVVATLEELAISFDSIGGMTMGADPVSHAVALLTGRSWYSVRKAEKDHGTRNRIEGARLVAGMQVVVFEDTVSTGRSVLDALDVVVESGVEIVAACTLLDRGDAATALFAGRNVPYFPLLSYRDLGIEPLQAPKTSEASQAADR